MAGNRNVCGYVRGGIESFRWDAVGMPLGFRGSVVEIEPRGFRASLGAPGHRSETVRNCVALRLPWVWWHGPLPTKMMSQKKNKKQNMAMGQKPVW